MGHVEDDLLAVGGQDPPLADVTLVEQNGQLGLMSQTNPFTE